MQKNILRYIQKVVSLIAFFPLIGYSQTFTYSVPGTSTLTVPANVTGITVTAWGAGGGGSKGFSGLKGTGGGGGGYASASVSVNPGDVISIYVGAGGQGATVSGDGNDGENSSVTVNSDILTAIGGTRGRSTNAPSGTGGIGGSSSFVGSWNSTVSFCGGYGANLISANSSTPGGGAGGGAGATSNGRNAGGSTSNCSAAGGTQNGGPANGNGGKGGDGGTGNANGADGANYGGGGGGNAGSGIGGDGVGGYITITYSIPLPITQLMFNAEYQTNQTFVSWSTTNEEKIHYYVLEYSHDGILFHSKDTIFASNNSAYTFYSAYYSLSEQTYLRLKIIEHSKTYSYSEIISTQASLNQTTLYPNPLVKEQPLTIDTNESGIATLFNGQGMALFKQSLTKGINKLILNDLPTGNYFVIILKDNSTISKLTLQIY